MCLLQAALQDTEQQVLQLQREAAAQAGQLEACTQEVQALQELAAQQQANLMSNTKQSQDSEQRLTQAVAQLQVIHCSVWQWYLTWLLMRQCLCLYPVADSLNGCISSAQHVTMFRMTSGLMLASLKLFVADVTKMVKQRRCTVECRARSKSWSSS